MREVRNAGRRPEVRAYGSLESLAPLGERLDALNLASRQPTPFGSLAYVRAFLAHDEFADRGYEPLFLVAFDGGEPVGWIALRRVRGRLLGLRADRIEFLVGHDNDRPRMATREADEARCAEAFLAYLVAREPSWSLVEWMEQDATSPLARAAADAEGLFVRRFEHAPNATVPCAAPSARAWYRGLAKSFRASVRAGLNRLAAGGSLEFVSSWEPAAVARLLDLHLDVEARSWKGLAAAGIGRHPRRVAFFRALVAAARPLRMSVRVMLLDGLPIASELNGAFGDTWFAFEATYDEDHRAAGPGHLLFLMTMRDAFARRARAVNLLNNYAYVKRRYGAAVTETSAVQLFRPWTALWARARLGDLRRAVLGRGPTQSDVDFNLDKPPAARGETRASDREHAVRRAAAVLAACGGEVERLGADALVELVRPGQAARGETPLERPA